MGEHTPGPWKVAVHDLPGGARPMRHNDGSFVVVAGEGDDLGPVADVKFKGRAKRGEAWNAADPVGAANARLIAAAPDLLAALNALLADVMENGSETVSTRAYEMTRAAIRKATEPGS